MQTHLLALAFGVALSLSAAALSQGVESTASIKSARVNTVPNPMGTTGGEASTAPNAPPLHLPSVHSRRDSKGSMTAADLSGDGKVWVNNASKTYHCAGTKYYGKTKVGEYMSEAEAKAKGNHANHRKICV